MSNVLLEKLCMCMCMWSHSLEFRKFMTESSKALETDVWFRLLILKLNFACIFVKFNQSFFKVLYFFLRRMIVQFIDDMGFMWWYCYFFWNLFQYFMIFSSENDCSVHRRYGFHVVVLRRQLFLQNHLPGCCHCPRHGTHITRYCPDISENKLLSAECYH